MAVIWLLPVPNRKPPATGTYLCPIYKTLTRAGRCPKDRSPEARETLEAARKGSAGEAAGVPLATHWHRARHCWLRPSREKKISPAVVVETEQPGTLAMQQCLWPGSPQAHTQKYTSLLPPALLSRSPSTGMGQGISRGVTCTALPGQCAAARAAVPPSCPCFPHYRHTVNNGPLHQLRDCCRDPYGQATEALDQTGHSVDLRPGLLAGKPTQPRKPSQPRA